MSVLESYKRSEEIWPWRTLPEKAMQLTAVVGGSESVGPIRRKHR